MQRKVFKERENYVGDHDSVGFSYGKELSTDGQPYWREGIGYEFTLAEVEAIEAATEDLHSICMETVQDIVESGDYPTGYCLSEASKELIDASWRDDDMHIYGRFDFMFESVDKIKMYEYNADTPTSLLEASIVQWDWMEEVTGTDQFNSIHSKLVERWKLARGNKSNSVLHFFAGEDSGAEDWGNLAYMADTALEAGWHIQLDSIENLGWDTTHEEFVDRNHQTVYRAFKLYPLEWMMADQFGQHILQRKSLWYEPEWKMLLSNKALLPVLWERYPNHPNLLPAYFEEANGYIKKALLGREGSNVFREDRLMEGSVFNQDYDGQYVYQEYCPLPEFNGYYPVIGSWVVGDSAAGMGIREDASLISGNGSHFVPHHFVD